MLFSFAYEQKGATNHDKTERENPRGTASRDLLYPFGKERSNQLLSLPPRRGIGVGSTHKQNKPQQKAGANVSIILGHFQKCLTVFST